MKTVIAVPLFRAVRILDRRLVVAAMAFVVDEPLLPPARVDDGRLVAVTVATTVAVPLATTVGVLDSGLVVVAMQPARAVLPPDVADSIDVLCRTVRRLVAGSGRLDAVDPVPAMRERYSRVTTHVALARARFTYSTVPSGRMTAGLLLSRCTLPLRYHAR